MAIHKDSIVDVDLTSGTIHRSFLNHSIGMNDSDGDFFGVRVFKGGEPVDLTNVSVQGHFNPPVGAPIFLNAGNYISGNVATVRLPQACYNYEGPFSLAIKLVTVNETVTVRIVDGMVDNTYVEGSVAPTGTVPTYQEVLAEYDQMVAATATANAAAQTAVNTANAAAQTAINTADTAAANCAAIVAAPYSNSATYAVGTYCTKDGKLYECTTAITTAEEWTAGHWTETKVGPEVSDLRNALNFTSESIENDFEQSTGNRAMVFKGGRYKANSAPDAGISVYYDPSSNYVCAICPCVSGDVFYMNLQGSTGINRAYYFLDSDMKIIGNNYGGSGAKITGSRTAPAGSAFVVFNNYIPGMGSGYYAYKNKALKTIVADNYNLFANSINDITGNYIYDGFTLNSWIDTSGTIDINSTEAYSDAAYIVVPCQKGDIFTLTGTGYTSSHMLYVVINESGTKLQSSGGSATLDKYVLEIKNDGSAYLVMNVNTSYSYSLYKNKLDITQIQENRNDIDNVNNNVFFPYTSFVNGNINTSGKNTGNTHPIRSGYIPIDEFVSVEVLTTGYRYQLFAYDGAYAYLGYGGTTRTGKKTRDDVLTDFPGTKYVRIKIGSSDDTEYLNPANLAAYGYTGLVRISQGTIDRIEIGGGGSSDEIDIMSQIESFKDEDGYYSESFVLNIDLSTVPKILSITSQYTGETAPTVQIKNINPATDSANLPSPVYVIGSTKEPTRKSWRLPMRSAVYTKGRIIFTIPSGTKVTIRDAQLKADQRNRNTEFGIRYHGHRGSIAPADTIEAFQLSAELGYNTMITIPKFTTDGVAICYHDDSNVSDLRMIDGSTIPDASTSPISSFSYDYITENFRIASTLWGILHVPTIEEYFRVCSLTGMKPIFSIHSSPSGMFTGSTGTAHFNTLKSLARKWGVLDGIGIKSGSDSIMSCAKGVFGTQARYIWLSGQSHDPYGIWNLSKSVGFVDPDATDLTGCEYDLTSEYFYSQTVEGAAHYEATMAQIADLYAKGFKISIAETDAISGAEMVRLIGIGVTEFTVDSHISMGLDW